MNISISKYQEWLIHLVIISLSWLFINFFTGDIQLGVFHTREGGFILPSLYGTALNAVLFYGNISWLIPQILRKKTIIQYLLWLGVFFVSITAVESFADQSLASYRGIEVNNEVLLEIILLILVVHILTLIASLAYKFANDWFKNERIKQNLVASNLQTELAFLRSQVSPHFLFNTLNNLFSTAIKNDDEETADGISRLAGLMRYMLYDSNLPKIQLSKEIDYLQDYLALQEMRVVGREDVDIQLTITGGIKQQQLSPMLLIPLVENAFKYGLSPSKPVTIHFHFTISEKRLLFEATNTVNKNYQTPDKHASGIGLKNIQRRLQLLYPDQHTLDITEQEGVFKARLVIEW